MLNQILNLSQIGKSLFYSAILIATSSVATAQTQNYFGASGALDGSVWSTVPEGPYDSLFDTTDGGIMNFNNEATFTRASLTVAGINATANATATGAGGIISTFGNGVIPIFVQAGVMLDFDTQNLGSGSATAGFSLNGGGVLATSGSPYGGGFTLNDGIVFSRGINSMGGNVATPGALNINGGAIASGANRDFSGKYSVINLGGNFQLGMLSSVLAISSDTANFTFNSAINLGTSTRAITIGGNGINTFSGVISGDTGAGLTFTKVPAATGTVVLGNANTYTGKTSINGIAVTIGSDASFGAAPETFVADHLTLDGATLRPSVNVTFDANRGITLGENGATIVGASGSALQTFNNSITGDGELTLATGAADFKTANSFSGGLVLSGTSGAIVARFNADNSAGTGVITVSPTATAGNTTLRNTGGISTSIGNDIIFNENNGKTVALVSDAGGTFTVSGQISGVGTVTRGLQGPGGEVILSGDNSGWSGGLNMFRGTTTIGHQNALGTGTLTISPNTGAFDPVVLQAATPLTGANAVATPVSIAIAGGAPQFTIGGNNDLELSGPIALSVTSPTITNNNTGATIFSGTISDGGAALGMTLEGTGRLTLSGDNTYSGATVVNGGTLIVNNTSGSGTGTGNVTVNSTGALKGSGNVAGAVILNANSTLAPGNSVGILDTGAQIWEGGATLQFEINDADGAAGTGFDLVRITGGLTLNATAGNRFNLDVTSLTLNLPGDAANFDKNQNYSWKFAEITEAITGFDDAAFNIITDNFSNDTEGFDSSNWFVTEQINGAGRDLYLNVTAVPEPSTVALGIMGGLAFISTIVRRRFQNHPASTNDR